VGKRLPHFVTRKETKNERERRRAWKTAWEKGKTDINTYRSNYKHTTTGNNKGSQIGGGEEAEEKFVNV